MDDDDKIIGFKNRDEIDYKNDIYRVSALWLVNSEGEILLAQRHRNKDKDPGVWGPAVSGTVEEGETYYENIVKEAAEEIGLTGVEFVEGPKQRIYEPRNFFTQWYVATVEKPEGSFIIKEEEVEKIAWVGPSFLKKDSTEHPEKYVATMPKIVEIFKL